MKKIFKLAADFEKKLALGTQQAYNKVRVISFFAKKLLSNSLSLQKASLRNTYSEDPKDIYEEVDSKRAALRAEQVRDLIRDIVRISNEFQQNAYLYGMPASTVSDYKTELLELISRIKKLSGESELLVPLTSALTALEPQPVYKQNRTEIEDDLVLVPEESKKIEKFPLPSDLWPTEKIEKIPLPSGLWPTDPSLEVDWNSRN